ncbi:MAG: hypothetical protein PHO75_02760 [Candidatus Shapirobacteria bacterium]|nr:hypothetical protein [Candidatus Shapirobacteria bacterium]
MIMSSPQLFEETKRFLTPLQQNLLTDVETILKKINSEDQIYDYAFFVAPIAKAYEGFLKDFFLKIGIISDNEYESDRFRVGKTLNPSLRYKRFSVFQKLSDIHQDGEELAESLWDAWKFGRNEIFHFFPNISQNLSRNEAEDRIDLLLKAMIKAGEFLINNKEIIRRSRLDSR